jgi:mRNA-degrading endonuclease RelE of RelBE toxin-antitoxin system
LVNDPYNSRSGVDIKRLQGRKHDMYRLRVGPHRFEYFVEEGKIWIDEGFTRGKGYR